MLEAQLKLGNVAIAEISAENGTFTVKFDVVSLDPGSYALTIEGNAVVLDNVDTEEKKGLISTFKLSLAETTKAVSLSITSDAKVNVKTATIFDETTQLELVLEGEKVIYKITGTYEAEYQGYDLTNAAQKELAEAVLANKLKAYFANFRFEHNGNQSSTGNWNAVAALTDSHYVTIVDDTHFTINCDVTMLQRGWVVMNKVGASTTPNSNGDYKPKATIEQVGNTAGAQEVVFNGNVYRMHIDKDSWNLLVIRVVEYLAPSTPAE